jgi:hypothetical protein
MRLSSEAVGQVASEYPRVLERFRDFKLYALNELAWSLKVEKAQEYLLHGVGRRVTTIERCLVNVFTAFPPEQTKILPTDAVSDVIINLQAFVFNVYGVFDNVAWVYILEQRRESSIEGGRRAIGLFDKRTQAHLSPKMLSFLRDQKISSWFSDYSKNFRDALAHRIPLYVPPFVETKEERKRRVALEAEAWAAIKEHRFEDATRLQAKADAIGVACAVFRHSFSDADGKEGLMLHPQMLADSNTILTLLEAVRADVKASGWASTPASS